MRGDATTDPTDPTKKEFITIKSTILNENCNLTKAETRKIGSLSGPVNLLIEI